MKTRISLFCSALILSACANGISSNGVSLGIGLGGMLGNHVGIGTSIHIPLQTQQTNSQHPPTLTETLIYFDAQGQYSDQPSKGGYRRQILGKQSDNAYLIQDFYETGGAKRTDPMKLSHTQLHEFRATPYDGTLTIYAINGNIMQQHTFQNGKIITK